MLNVAYTRGKGLAPSKNILSQLEPGDAFWFASRPLELVRVKDMTAQVKDTKNSMPVSLFLHGRPAAFELSDVGGVESKMNQF